VADTFVPSTYNVAIVMPIGKTLATVIEVVVIVVCFIYFVSIKCYEYVDIYCRNVMSNRRQLCRTFLSDKLVVVVIDVLRHVIVIYIMDKVGTVIAEK